MEVGEKEEEVLGEIRWGPYRSQALEGVDIWVVKAITIAGQKDAQEVGKQVGAMGTLLLARNSRDHSSSRFNLGEMGTLLPTTRHHLATCSNNTNILPPITVRMKIQTIRAVTILHFIMPPMPPPLSMVITLLDILIQLHIPNTTPSTTIITLLILNVTSSSSNNPLILNRPGKGSLKQTITSISLRQS
eukprot:gb/GEZN01012460.1/.p2 GENE.gb/GEZN01012460.1/~~gb/GEZN01012460.1/.p2  ORF type:complete len:189 (+),score=28.26 gb/GEZN01012460.1/:160-726(+)